MSIAGRRSRDQPGPDGAPRADGSDPRWSAGYQAIVTTHPELKLDLLEAIGEAWEQGARSRPGDRNPWWLTDADVAGDPIPQPSRRPMNRTLLVTDAQNRAARTFLVGLAIDLAVAVALLLVTVFDDANGWDDIDTGIVLFSLAKTVVATAGSYILRRFLDPSRIPTPLPPAPVAAPADPV